VTAPEGTLATLQHLELLTNYGVGWRSFTEQYLDSTGVFKDAVIAILATIAKQERVRISERVRAGLARARKKGQRLGRRVRVDAAQVRKLRAKGLSWRQIEKKMRVPRSTCMRAVR
jgi:DNA invertase Pin-like site-specific DNA recombinase